MVFKNREEAATLLFEKLKKYSGKNALVLGIPRGAMPMAQMIAEELEGELNAILVHKIPAPGYEELAVGAVGLSGDIFRLPTIEEFSISEEYLQMAARQQVQILRRRQEMFHLEEPDCRNRLVIIVDDGIATGASVMGAIHEVQRQHPQKLIVAAAAVAKSTADQIRPLVDELVSLTEPEFFYAVSQFYLDFSQVSDEEVSEIITRSRSNQKTRKKTNKSRKEQEPRPSDRT